LLRIQSFVQIAYAAAAASLPLNAANHQTEYVYNNNNYYYYDVFNYCYFVSI